MAINFLNNPKVGDNTKIEIGTGSDLQIYHDGSNSFITNSTGDLTVGSILIDTVGNVGIGLTPASTVLLDLKEADSTADLIIGLTSGTGARAQIRSIKQVNNTSSELSFYTTASSSTSERMRIKSTGQVQFNAYGQEDFTGTAAYQLAVDSSGNVIEVGASDLPGGPYLPLGGGTMTGNTVHNDNVKSIYGTGSDFEIYFDTTNTILNAVAGSLKINAGTENMITATRNDGVNLYYDGTLRLNTSEFGVTVQTIVMDGGSYELNVDTVTNAGGILEKGKYIYTSESDAYLRKLIGRNSSSIEIGQAGTSLIGEINLLAGSAGSVNVYNNSSVAATFKSGNLGLGTTSPDLKLDVESADTTVFSGTGYRTALFQSTSAVNTDKPGITLGYDTTGGGIIAPATQSGTTNFLGFWTYNSGWGERMRLDIAGNLGIGTTTASSKLTVKDNSYQVMLVDTSTSNRGEISVEDAAFGFYADRAASTADSSFFWSIDNLNKMEINLTGGGEGQLRLNDYGPGNITGTVEFILGVDANGNVIETSAGGSGTVTGTGAATRVAFWSGTTALSSDANLYWDNTNDRLGIGTTTPDYPLDVVGNIRTQTHLLVGGDSTSDGRIYVRLADDTTKIFISSNSSSYFNGGNVGIGTTSPSNKLTVNQGGGVRVTGITNGTYIELSGDLPGYSANQ